MKNDSLMGWYWLSVFVFIFFFYSGVYWREVEKAEIKNSIKNESLLYDNYVIKVLSSKEKEDLNLGKNYAFYVYRVNPNGELKLLKKNLKIVSQFYDDSLPSPSLVMGAFEARPDGTVTQQTMDIVELSQLLSDGSYLFVTKFKTGHTYVVPEVLP
jgi:hypothetical protein